MAHQPTCSVVPKSPTAQCACCVRADASLANSQRLGAAAGREPGPLALRIVELQMGPILVQGEADSDSAGVIEEDQVRCGRIVRIVMKVRFGNQRGARGVLTRPALTR